MTAVPIGLMGGIGLVLIMAAWVGAPAFHISRPRWVERWWDQIIRSGIPGLTPVRQILATGALFLLALFVVLAWTGAWTVSIVVALMLAPLPSMAIAGRARSRMSAMREAWPEVIDSLVSGVRAGSSLPELLSDMGNSGPTQLRPQFLAFAADYRSDGRFDSALTRLKDRFADPVADRIVEALRLAREVGGSDLSTLLRDLGVLLREDARVRGELEARQSWTVNAARLGVAAPWLVLIIISSQSQAAQAYSTAQGVLVLTIGAIVSIVAYLMMLRIGRLPIDQRSLR